MTSEELNEKTYNLAVDRFMFDKEKADSDRVTERNKIKWTAISILGSVVVAAISIVSAAALQNSAANTQFKLKAAELVLQSDDPEVNKDKAARFQELFPGRMESDWSKSFDWKKHADENDDMKTAFAKLLAEHPDPNQRKQIIDTYRILFVDDSTVQSFLDRLLSDANQKANLTKATSTK